MADALFAGKTVVIAGSGRGLALGMARRFGRAGAHLVVADTDARAGRDVVQLLLEEGHSASYEVFEPRDPERVAALVERIGEGGGRIDVWVNNLFIEHKGAAETLAHEAWRESIDLILSGAFYCSQAAGRHMLRQGWGTIINVTSIDGYQAVEGNVAPCAAHAGLVMLTQALGVEWACRGIRVVGVAPGTITTDFPRKAAGADPDQRRMYEHRTPLRRLGTVEEVAETVLYLASEEASYVTAETMKVDGGWTAYQMF
jgi:NAD(P)-dependent dehydrogenase (short-subunit alcohol dehydrogenase family)